MTRDSKCSLGYQKCSSLQGKEGGISCSSPDVCGMCHIICDAGVPCKVGCWGPQQEKQCRQPQDPPASDSHHHLCSTLFGHSPSICTYTHHTQSLHVSLLITRQELDVLLWECPALVSGERHSYRINSSFGMFFFLKRKMRFEISRGLFVLPSFRWWRGQS